MPPTFSSTFEADLAGRTTFDAKSQISDGQLFGLRVVVTGGAGGIGEACCRRLIAGGALVVIADRSEDVGRALEHELGSERAKFISVDIGNWMSQLEMFKGAIRFFGGSIDSLITCAAVKPDAVWNLPPSEQPDSLLNVDLSTIPKPGTQCVDVNLTGTMYSLHIARTYCMSENSSEGSRSSYRKSIVLLGSTSCFRPMPARTDYSIAKWGVRGLFRNYRSVLPRQGVRINMMAPFWVPTKLTEGHVPKGIKPGKLEDTVDGIVRMLCDREMNGRAIAVTANGLEDLGDDIAGRDGGEAMFRLVRDGWLSVPESATLSTKSSL